MSHVVYLLADGPLHKIGWTKNLPTRLRELLTEYPSATLAHSIGTQRGRKLETTLHRRFEAKAVGGEWFALDSDDVALIRSLTECRWPDQLPDWLQCDCRRWGITPKVPDMPSTRPLLAVRLTPDELSEFNAIRAAATAAVGLPVSQADLVRLALPLLRSAYPPAAGDAPPPPGRGSKKGGKKPTAKS